MKLKINVSNVLCGCAIAVLNSAIATTYDCVTATPNHSECAPPETSIKGQVFTDITYTPCSSPSPEFQWCISGQSTSSNECKPVTASQQVPCKVCTKTTDMSVYPFSIITTCTACDGNAGNYSTVKSLSGTCPTGS